MTNKELRKLSRAELLEMLIEQSKEIDRLQDLLSKASEKYESRRLDVDEAGSIAVASLKLNGVFESAQKAADLYVANVQGKADRQMKQCEIMEQETREKCTQMVDKTKNDAKRYLDEIHSKLCILSSENEDIRLLLSTVKPPEV